MNLIFHILYFVTFVIFAGALYFLFKKHLVNLPGWHALVRQETADVAADLAAFKQWCAEHLHLSTAPPAAAPNADAAEKK